MKKTLFILIAAAASFFPLRSLAAVITVGPSATDPQTVAVTLDTQGEQVNAVELHLSFDTDLFSVSGINTGGSVIDLWVSGPSFSNALGTVDLAGIIPGGDTVASGTIATITLVPKEPEVKTGFIFDSGQVLLNDGKGTPAPLSVVINPFTLAGAGSAPPALTTKAPNAFTPEVGQDPSIFGGKYFLVFSTTDQQSGIDHYDVLEVPAGTKVTSSSPWTTATSPYLLQDQSLSSDIYVRAVNNAGNFRVEEIPATHPAPSGTSAESDAAVILGVIMVLLIIGAGLWFFWQWKRNG